MRRKEWRRQFLERLAVLINEEDGCGEEIASKIALEFLEAASLDVCMEGFEKDPIAAANDCPQWWAEYTDGPMEL